MANRIVSVHAGIYGMGIYAIMLPSSGSSVAHYRRRCVTNNPQRHLKCAIRTIPWLPISTT